MLSKNHLFWFISTLAAVILLMSVAPRALVFLPGVLGLVFFSWQWKSTNTRPAIPFAVLLVCVGVPVMGVLSALWAHDPAQSIERAYKTALIFLPGSLLIGFVTTVEIQKLKSLLWVVPAFVAATIAVICIDLAFDYPFYRLTHGMMDGARIPPDVMNRSAVAVSLCLFPAFVLAGYVRPARALVLRGVLIAPMIVLLFLTASQSAQMAVALGLLFMVAFPYRSRLAWGVLAGGLVGGIMLAPFLAEGAFAWLRAHDNQSWFFTAVRGAHMEERLEIWDFIASYALKNPLYGFGMDVTRTITEFDTARLYHPAVSTLHPHNFVLQIWIEFGALGALLTAGLMLYILRAIYRLELAARRAALPLFVASLSVVLVAYGLWQGWWLGLLILVTALSIMAVRAEEDEAHKDNLKNSP